MSVMGLSSDVQQHVLNIVAGVLHLGNISFVEKNNNAEIANRQCQSTDRYILLTVFPVYLVIYPRQRLSRGYGFYRCLSVCFSARYVKNDAALIAKLNIEMFHDESWKSLNF